MTLSEKLLLALSRKPDENDYITTEKELNIETALNTLEREYGNLKELVLGKMVVDFGCGYGHQAAALVLNYGCKVVGIENNPGSVSSARDLKNSNDRLTEKLNFSEEVTEEMKGSFDIVISQNSMEHFPDPVVILNIMKSLLKPDGKLLITFGPPWHAPYGSHMQFFCQVPWVNVLFSEKTVMSVRKCFRDDGAEKYEEVEMGLNCMSLNKFEKLIDDLGMEIEFSKYSCSKGLPLTRVPVVRELFTNHVSVVLTF